MREICVNPGKEIQCYQPLSDYATLPPKPQWDCSPKDPSDSPQPTGWIIFGAIILPVLVICCCCYLFYRFRKEILGCIIGICNWCVCRETDTAGEILGCIIGICNWCDCRETDTAGNDIPDQIDDPGETDPLNPGNNDDSTFRRRDNPNPEDLPRERSPLNPDGENDSTSQRDNLVLHALYSSREGREMQSPNATSLTSGREEEDEDESYPMLEIENEHGSTDI